MRYIKNYKLFETENYESERDKLIGKLLHIYGSIPLSKQKSHIVIKKILWSNHHKLSNDNVFYNLGDDVDLAYNSPQDKVRFVDYFDSLLKAKEIRGHNFEGFIAGIYGGELSEPGEKWDVVINDNTWSVKFVDNPNKAPEIGSFRTAIPNDIFDNVHDNGLTNIFKGDDLELKEKLWNVISKGITGGWLIAYNIDSEIIVNIIDLKSMKNILLNGGTTSPKGGMKASFSLALSAKYKKFTKKFKIKIPKLDTEELKSIYFSKEEELWGEQVFGPIVNKIRPDVLRHIQKNAKDIGSKLLKFKYF